jgi:hypothetical protein
VAKLATATTALYALTAGALLAGAGGFETFPTIELETGASTLALCVTLPALALLPFAGDRGGNGILRKGGGEDA